MNRPREVLVGTPLIAASKMQTASTGINGTITNTKDVQRVTGVRSMSVVFLQRLAAWLRDKGFSAAAPEVLGWLDPKQHKTPESEAVVDLLAKLEASKPYVSPREAAYLDAAIFCVTAWAVTD